jgi:hypothetical protein
MAQSKSICATRERHWGSIARYSLFGPGYESFDLSVFKNTMVDIGEFPVNIQFRPEIYNLFNRVNLASPASTQLGNDYFGSGSEFGTSGSTIGSGNYAPGIGPGEPLNVQLAPKVNFLRQLTASSNGCRDPLNLYNSAPLLSTTAVRLQIEQDQLVSNIA